MGVRTAGGGYAKKGCLLVYELATFLIGGKIDPNVGGDVRSVSVVDRDICLVVKDVTIGGTDDALALEVEFFDAVRGPAYDSRHGEQRGVDFLREAYHFVNEAGIEVDV